MFKRAWEYVVNVAKHYKGHVSGWLLAITAVALQIATSWVSGDPSRSAAVVKWSAWLTTAGAIWALFVAQYDAWREQKKIADDERAKNALPSIGGEAYAFVSGAQLVDQLNGVVVRGTKFSFTLYLINERQVPTNLKRHSAQWRGVLPPSQNCN